MKNVVNSSVTENTYMELKCVSKFSYEVISFKKIKIDML